MEEKTIDDKVAKTISNFQHAYAFQSKNIEQVKEDYEYYLGKGWTDEQDAESVANGQGKLTYVNNIRPYIHLLEGYQRQNRNDIIAYPEGDEDSLQAETVTRLIKNTLKMSKGEYKQSEQYKHGCVGGAAYLFPYMDYSKDIITGHLKLKMLTGVQVFYDPSSVEYDMSDCRYQCLFTEKMTKEDIKTLFPEFDIDNLECGRISVSGLGDGVEPYTRYYYKNGVPTNNNGFQEEDIRCYDMLQYFYKKHQNKYILINLENNGTQESYIKEKLELLQKEMTDKAIESKLIVQREAVVWRRVIVGESIVEDKEAEFSKYWKDYPLNPFRAYYCNVEIKDKGKYQVQGVVRPMKAPQKEKNIARIFASRHLKSSQNSGWLAEEKSFVDKAKVAQHGAKEGVIIEFKKSATRVPEKIQPTALSQGFEFLSKQSTEDLKACSGINSDLLSMDNSSDSGRAILLRTKQGLVMIQGLQDNLSQTTDQLGRFLVSILPQLYTPEKALRVLGEAFLNQHFGVDQQQEDPATGETVIVGREIDQQAAMKFITEILNDKDLANYNIAIGEGVNSETVKFANFMTLNEMVKNGYPIPPDVLIDETTLASATKEKIKNSLKQAQGEQKK